MPIQELHEELTPTEEDSTPPQLRAPSPESLSSSQPLSFGTALVLVAPRIVSGIGAIGLALPVAFEIPSLLRSVGAAGLAVKTTGWTPVLVSLGVAGAASLLVLAAANKRGIQQLTGLLKEYRKLRTGK